jgi:hypothetical protein
VGLHHKRLFCLGKALLLGLLLVTMACLWPVSLCKALVKMDAQSEELAILYGLQNQDLGLSTLLGPNWREGPQGTLLNIYTPFMLLASRAAKVGVVHNPPQPKELAAAKTYCQRMIRDFHDPHYPQRIKFSVSFYGTSPDDGLKTSASIEGLGRGQRMTFAPVDQVRQKAPITGTTQGPFEFINVYYFNVDDISQLDDYVFTLTPPTAKLSPATPEPISFHIRNKIIY